MPEDYGGMRLMSPGEVAAISQDLRHLDELDIEQRYHAYDFNGRYHANDSRPGCPVEDLVADFITLRQFHQESADQNCAMIVYLC